MSNDLEPRKGLRPLALPRALPKPDYAAIAESLKTFEPAEYPELHPALLTYAEDRISNRCQRDPELGSRLADWTLLVWKIHDRNMADLRFLEGAAAECKLSGLPDRAVRIHSYTDEFRQKMAIPRSYEIASRAKNLDRTLREREERKKWKEGTQN